MIFFYNGNSAKASIYEIRNRVTNRSYIGQTHKLKDRWQDHRQVLLGERKTNKFLLADYKKCKELLGHDDFLEFHIVEILVDASREERLQREEYWIGQAVTIYGEQNIYNFNLTPTTEVSFFAPKGPRKNSGQYRPGAEHPYFGRSSPMKGKTLSPEARLAMIGRGLGRTDSHEVRKKKSLGRTGKRASEQTLAKMRDSRLGLKQSAETIEKRRQKMLGALHPGWIPNISKDWLVEQYTSYQKTVDEIAKESGFSRDVIYARLSEYQIPIRNRSESRLGRHRRFDLSKEELTVLVWTMPVSCVGKACGVAGKTVEHRCRQYGIPTPPRGYWRKRR